MNYVDIITENPSQVMSLVLENGNNINLNLRYSQNQKGWFYDLSYLGFNLYGRRVVTSPNMLRQFKNYIPFGLAVVTTDGHEPVFIEDFKNKRASMYTLNEEDVATVEELLADNG